MTTGLLFAIPEPLPLQQAAERVLKLRALYRAGVLDPRAAILSFSILAVHPHERVRRLARQSLDEVAVEDVDFTDNGVVAR